MMKTALSLVVAGLTAVLALLAFNTARYGPPPIQEVALAPPLEVKPERLAAQLGGALNIPTVSLESMPTPRPEVFFQFREYLLSTYPGVENALDVEVIADHSMLLVWTGSDATLDPMLFSAHMDVVPAPDPEGDWTEAPFSGAVSDGFIWGRGALDMKQSLVGYLEATEALLASGYTPRRTVIFAFTHDEETGSRGAARIAQVLAERGIALEATLDEGLVITTGVVPGVDAPVATIGIAQKGYLTVELSLSSAGGHSSMPPATPVASRLARALVRLADNPMPHRIDGAAAEMFRWLSPQLPLHYRVGVANQWLLGGVVARIMSDEPAANAMIRTTAAPTIVEIGEIENVLPQSARAVINFRLLQGDSVQSILAYVEKTIADPGITVRQLGDANEPSPVASTESRAFRVLAAATREVFPDAIIAPSLLVGITDSRNYVTLAKDSYFFLPSRLSGEDLTRIHGTDERIAVSNYADIVRFYTMVLRGRSSE